MVLETICQSVNSNLECTEKLSGFLVAFNPLVFPTLLFTIFLGYSFLTKSGKITPNTSVSLVSGHFLGALGGINILKAFYIVFLIGKSFFTGSGISTGDIFSSLLLIAIDLVQLVVAHRFLPADGDAKWYASFAFAVLLLQFLLGRYLTGGAGFEITDVLLQALFRAVIAIVVSIVAITYQKANIPTVEELVSS